MLNLIELTKWYENIEIIHIDNFLNEIGHLTKYFRYDVYVFV